MAQTYLNLNVLSIVSAVNHVLPRYLFFTVKMNGSFQLIADFGMMDCQVKNKFNKQ